MHRSAKLYRLAAIGGFVCVLAAGETRAQAPAAVPLPAGEITRIKAQEFARSLAQLKIQEVAITRTLPVDDKALALNRAQQNALEQELVHLAVAPLIAQRDRLAGELRPGHPRMIALNAEIEQARASVTSGH